MKPWHAILIVVAVLGIGCCGGLFLIGNKAYTGYNETGSEATAYADEEIPKILNNWNYKELEKVASPELQRQPESVVKAYFDLYQKSLGKFQSVKPSSMVGSNFYTGTGGAVTTSTVVAQASFYRDNGRITLVLVKRDGKWSINGFAIKSKILDEAVTKHS